MMAAPAHAVYCRGCRRAWVSCDIPIVWLDDAARVAAGAAVDDCRCICADDSDPLYEAWVTDPEPGEIPEGAWTA